MLGSGRNGNVPQIQRSKSACAENSSFRSAHVGTAAVAAASLSSVLPPFGQVTAQAAAFAGPSVPAAKESRPRNRHLRILLNPPLRRRHDQPYETPPRLPPRLHTSRPLRQPCDF